MSRAAARFCLQRCSPKASTLGRTSRIVSVIVLTRTRRRRDAILPLESNGTMNDDATVAEEDDLRLRMEDGATMAVLIPSFLIDVPFHVVEAIIFQSSVFCHNACRVF